jgi:subtilisin family serine protease
MLLTVSILFFGVLSLFAEKPEFAANRYFVTFNQPMTSDDPVFLQSLGVGVGKTFPEIQSIEITIQSPDQLAAIRQNARVEYVEAVPMRYATSLSTQQVVPSLDNGLYGLVSTKAVDVHNLGYSATAVKVGVADTAIDCSHVDIAANLVETIDEVGDKTHGGCWQPGDTSELHGTHVAGILVGVFNNAGIYGVAYGASLYHARVLGPGGGTSSEVMAGVQWLVDTAGVRVVNLSLGGNSPSISEERFYAQIRRKGVLVVAAAGNDGKRKITYPAAYGVNIAVGAVDRNNVLASDSNTGRNLDLVAPGVMVLSSVPTGQGTEASVTTTTTFGAFAMEFSGKSAGTGITGNLFDCGLAITPAQCPAGVFGNIALIQRGVNTFEHKVANAMTAGATAVIIYNDSPGDFQASLSDPDNGGQPWVPAVTVSDTAGATFLGQVGTSANVSNIASSWDTFSGTSMAAPHASGTIALMWGVAPNLSNSDIEDALFSTATDLGDPGYDKTFGFGLINALAAVQKVIAP